MLKDLEELRDAILFYQRIKKENRIKHSYIFLDEVTSIEEWWRIIKGFIDMGIFAGDSVTISGSSTLRILKHKEAFPGRRGFGRDIEVLPLSFPEFLEIKGVKGKKIATSKREIHRLFQEYIEVGGYPKSINQMDFLKDLISSIESEIERNNKSAALLKQITSTRSLPRNRLNKILYTNLKFPTNLIYPITINIQPNNEYRSHRCT